MENTCTSHQSTKQESTEGRLAFYKMIKEYKFCQVLCKQIGIISLRLKLVFITIPESKDNSVTEVYLNFELWHDKKSKHLVLLFNFFRSFLFQKLWKQRKKTAGAQYTEENADNTECDNFNTCTVNIS